MHKKKLTFIFLSLIFFIILFTGYSFAKDFKTNITANKTEINPGDTITIQVSVQDLVKENVLVNVFLCTLDYDRNIFEEVKEENIKLLNGWTGLTFNSNNGKILLDKASNMNPNETLFEVSLKSKETSDFNETRISITNPQSSENGESINGIDSNIIISNKSNSNFIIFIIFIIIIVFIFIFIILKSKKRKQT